MQYARPPEGFNLREHPQVLETLACMREQCPWLDGAYRDLVARLRMSGHVEGTPTARPWVRAIVELNPRTGRKRLGISYHVKGSTLKVIAIRVLTIDGGEISN
jgi:hypothetical protein